MDSKVTSTLEKSLQDKAKGHHQKALRRLADALARFPDEVELYMEAADVCLDAGESLQATQYLKMAFARFRDEKERLDTFASERLSKLRDPVLGKFLLEQFVKRRDLALASDVLEELPDRSVRELLQRVRTKQQTLTAAARGGHALKSEMMINGMNEALLCLRLGRMKESVRPFLEILDEKPVENEVLEPFFAVLEKKYPKVGRIRYAYACSLIASQQIDNAMSRLIQAVRLEPNLAEDALARLRDLAEKFEMQPDSMQQALVEILVVKGDVARAVEILQKVLSDTPERAQLVMDIIGPLLEEVADTLVLHYLYIDAALILDQTRRASEMLKKIGNNDDQRDDVYQWLETKSNEGFLPIDVMLVHGEFATDTGNAERAVEVFRAIADNEPAEIPGILRIIRKKGRHADQRLIELAEDLSAEQQEAEGLSSDDGKIEHLDDRVFDFASDSQSEPTEEKVVELSLDDEPSGPAADIEAPAPVPFERERNIQDERGDTPDSLIADLKRAVGDAVHGHGDLLWEEEDASGAVEESEDVAANVRTKSWLETHDDAISSVHDENAETETVNPAATETPSEPTEPVEPKPPAETNTPKIEITADHVNELADALRDAGARLFFHVDDEADSETEDDPPQPSENVGPPPRVKSLCAKFEQFLDGHFDNSELLEMATEAVELGLPDEARELLHFEPKDVQETLARKRCLVDYYLSIDKPIPALGIIETIRLASLTEQERLDVLTKKAACQKFANDLEGAHKTYLRIMREFPSPEIDEKAKRNYERYLQNQCEGALVLEKTASIHDE